MHKWDFERPSGARSYPSPEYFGCAFAMVRMQAREKRREIVRSLLPLLRWGQAMVGRHPRRLEVVTVDEITSAIRCNRPCDCWHVIEDFKLKLHSLCCRFVLGDLTPKSFVLFAEFGGAPRMDFQGDGEFCLLRRGHIRADSDSGSEAIGPV